MKKKKSEKSHKCMMVNSNVNWEDVYNKCHNKEGKSCEESDNVDNYLENLRTFLDKLYSEKISGVTLKAQNCISFKEWIYKKKMCICEKVKADNEKLIQLKNVFNIPSNISTNFPVCFYEEDTKNVCYGSSSNESAYLSSTEKYPVTYDALIIKLVYSIFFPLLTVYSKIKTFLYNKYIKVCSIKNNMKKGYSSNNTEEFFLGPEGKRINIQYLSKEYA
ncbi:variable surface protein [Plasmodium gonderi]|uniref:Variable surface protein n=1 Tax=Plasmodium gonderi TaxID=77519 RepID=A0A1Y1JUY2_PLAGO|nr:variable surface protein [Plasmodium gonderi]GAW84223.1 variable surface protein [Plasmodium gonderi]